MAVKTTGQEHGHSSLWDAACSLALVVGSLPSLAHAEDPKVDGPLLIPPGQHNDPDPIPNTPQMRDGLLDMIDVLASKKDISTYESAKLHWKLLGDPIANYVRLLKETPEVPIDELSKAARIAYAPVNFTSHYEWSHPEAEVVDFVNHRILALHETIIHKCLAFESESVEDNARLQAIVSKLRRDLFWSKAHKYDGVIEHASQIIENAFLAESDNGTISAANLYDCINSGSAENPIMIRLLERNTAKIIPLFNYPDSYKHLSPEEEATTLVTLLPIYKEISRTVEASRDPFKLSPSKAAVFQDWFDNTLSPALRDSIFSLSLRVEDLHSSAHWNYDITTEQQYEDFTNSIAEIIHSSTEKDPALARKYLDQIEDLLNDENISTEQRTKLYLYIPHIALSNENQQQLTDFITRRIAKEKDTLSLCDGLGTATAIVYLRYHLEQRDAFEDKRSNILLDKDLEREKILLSMRARIDIEFHAPEHPLAPRGFDSLVRDLLSNASLGYDFSTFRGERPIQEKKDILEIAQIRTHCIHTANGFLTAMNHLSKREYGKAKGQDTLGKQIHFFLGSDIRWQAGVNMPCGNEYHRSLEELAALVNASEQELTKIHGYGLTLNGQAELIHAALRIYQTEHTTLHEGALYQEEKYAELKKLYSRDYRTAHNNRALQGPFLENYKGARDYLYMKTFRNSADFAKLKDFVDQKKAEEFDKTALRFADAHRDTVVLYLIRSLWQQSRDDGTSVLTRSGSHSSNVRKTLVTINALGLRLVDLTADSDFQKLCTESTTKEEFLTGLEKIHSVRSATRNELWKEIITRNDEQDSD